MRIYFDYNATSPLRPEAQEAIASAIAAGLGNPSSIHTAGRAARRKLDEAREEIALFIGASPSEIIFTSGGTEANHLAWNAFSKPQTLIISTTVEHASVQSAADLARSRGAEVGMVEIERSGSVSESSWKSAMDKRPAFVSLQWANNETGVVQPLAPLAQQARQAGAVVHSDAVQCLGKMPVDVRTLPIDFLTISGHKVGAPSGVGALFVRRGTRFDPIWGGGSQERGRRTGTENVLGILAMAAACRGWREDAGRSYERTKSLRNAFEQLTLETISGVEVVGRTSSRLPNTSKLIFEDVDGESLLVAADLDGLCCSSGSACTSGAPYPSHVLIAMGYTPEQAQASLRFSFGWQTTEEEIDQGVKILSKVVERVRREGASMQQRTAS